METLKVWYDQLLLYIPNEVWYYLPTSVITRTLLIGSTTGLIAYWIFKRRYKLPPGPFSIPLIGSPFFFKKGDLVKNTWDISKKYGPVYTAYLGTTRTVVICRLDLINEALLKKGHHFADRSKFHTSDVMLNNSEDIIFSSYGTAWKLRRKVAARAIRLFLLKGNFNGKIEDAVSKTVAAMLKEEGAFDPKPYLFYTTLNIIAAMCFGVSYEYTDPMYKELLENLEENARLTSSGFVLENVTTVFTPFFYTSKFKKIQAVFKKFMAYVGGHVDTHRKTFTPGVIRDFTDSILEAEREIAAEGEENMAYFGPIHVLLIIFDIFFAGNDTSRMTLYWALMYIVGVPDVQRKLQEEMDRVVGKDRYPTTQDREHLHYADAVLHETMRLAVVAPLGVPHKTSCDTTLGEYDIPKDTMVFIHHWGIQNDPDIWPEPEKFKPERFLDEEGKMAPKPDNWLPFSAGRRVCLGEPLAKPELHLILASLFQQLELTQDDTEENKIDLKPMLNGFITSPKPYKLRAKKRV